MSEKYNDYLKTAYWKGVSDAVKKRADYRCQVCNSQHDLCAHHRTYEHRGMELHHLSDLVCLCRRCHAIFHGKEVSPPVPVAPVVMTKKEKRARGEIDLVEVESDMPSGDGAVILTKESIEKCFTVRGGITNASITALGARKPLRAGWPARLVGNRISRAEYRQALEGRYIYGKKLA